MIIGWFIFSIIVGIIGANRNIGFWGAFLLSLILSPLIGIIVTLISKDQEEEEYKNEILKTQEAQKTALEKLTTKNLEVKKELTTSIADEIIKMKKLKDSGTITEEDFISFKNKLINGKS
jgi:hypothetical protein